MSSRDNEERFREIFFEYHRPVVSFFQNRGFSHEESLDLAQDTFLRVFRSMDSFRGDSSVATWVFRIASNTGIKALRHRATLKRRAVEEHNLWENEEEDSLAEFVAADTGALQGMLAEERVRFLREALLDLPPRMRRCAELRIFLDLDYHEIAELMRISIQTVKSQLSEARKRLKDKVGDPEGMR